MRVLHVITSLSTGGAETMLRNVALAIDSTRVESFVVSLTTQTPIGDELIAGGVRVLALGGRRSVLSISQIRKLLASVADWRPNVVHGWMYHANLAAYLAVLTAGNVRPALITSVRGALDAPERQKFALRAIRRVDAILSRASEAVIFNSASSARQHVSLGYDGRRVELIPNGFDTDKFRPSESMRREVRSSLGLGDALVIGLVGRFDPLKGHREFLQAAGALISRVPEARFVLVGRGCEVTNLALGELIRENGLERHVVLLGERRDVAAVDNALDMSVSASVSESFPNSIGEAMSCAVPVVATDTGDCRQLVGDGGIVVPARDPAALATAMITLAEGGADCRRAIGERGRARIAKMYALPAIAEQYAALYERVVVRRRADPR